jgi:hypothetical protein
VLEVKPSSKDDPKSGVLQLATRLGLSIQETQAFVIWSSMQTGSAEKAKQLIRSIGETTSVPSA